MKVGALATTEASRLQSALLFRYQTMICHKTTPLSLLQHSTDESMLIHGINLAGFERSGTDKAGSEEQALRGRENEPRRWGRSSCGGSSRPSSTAGRQPRWSGCPRPRSRRIQRAAAAVSPRPAARNA